MGLRQSQPPGVSPKRSRWEQRRLWLEIAVFAAVEAVLVGPDSFFTLRGHSNPVLYRRIPVQITVLDDLADFEKSRVMGRSWLCLACIAHVAI